MCLFSRGGEDKNKVCSGRDICAEASGSPDRALPLQHRSRTLSIVGIRQKPQHSDGTVTTAEMAVFELMKEEEEEEENNMFEVVEEEDVFLLFAIARRWKNRVERRCSTAHCDPS